MPPSRKNHEQEAANHPNRQRQHVQNLLNLLARRRIKAAQHILVPHRHRHKHQHRRCPVHKVNQPHPILSQIRTRTCVRPRVEEPQAVGRGKAVACWDLGDSGGLVAVGVGGLGMDVCFVVVGLDLRDIFMGLRNVLVENIKRGT